MALYQGMTMTAGQYLGTYDYVEVDKGHSTYYGLSSFPTPPGLHSCSPGYPVQTGLEAYPTPSPESPEYWNNSPHQSNTDSPPHIQQYGPTTQLVFDRVH